jgi:Ni/Co efflux regulator RcnB
MGNQGAEGEGRKEDENDTQRRAFQDEESNNGQDCISRECAHKSLVHDRILIVTGEIRTPQRSLHRQEVVNMKRLIVNNIVCGMVLAGTMIASANAGTITQRKENQQDRIAQGVKSGQLTAHETASLENKEARLNRQIRNDRGNDNGHLTAGERARVNRGQNTLSRDIYRDKHNGAQQ